jgi:hypothetical protein
VYFVHVNLQDISFAGNSLWADLLLILFAWKNDWWSRLMEGSIMSRGKQPTILSEVHGYSNRLSGVEILGSRSSETNRRCEGENMENTSGE